jgi:Ala-tRNA(Pro) deacylase
LPSAPPSGRPAYGLIAEEVSLMISEKVKGFLDRNDARYGIIEHSPAYTAHEIAQSAHISGHEVAKTVIVDIDDVPAMVVLPASNRVEIDDVRRVVGSEDVHLAKEREISRLFPDCELGAMPPFGNLYGLDVYVHPALATNKFITFNGGTHVSLIRMAYEDFEKLVKPRVLTLV